MRNALAKTILIVAGEASGDQHGADLVRALRTVLPGTRFVGIGGDKMAAAGVDLLYHISDFAVLGISEVIRHIPFFRRVLKQLKHRIYNEADAVILIDYPGFNLRLARVAHQAGKKVIYYICPQLWAWGERRVHKIRRFVDLALVIFDFEKSFFQKHGVNVEWVGHPLVDQLNAVTISREEFLQKNALPEDKPVLALLPGSRTQEIHHLLPLMVESARSFTQEFSVVVGKSPTVADTVYAPYLPSGFHLLSNQTHALMKHAYAAIVASGTATLELGYFATPMVVVYKVSPLTYWLGKRLVKINNIALVNIVAGETVVPEFIQHDAQPGAIRSALQKYMTDAAYYQQTRERLGQIREKLGPPGASERAARKIAEIVA